MRRREFAKKVSRTKSGLIFLLSDSVGRVGLLNLRLGSSLGGAVAGPEGKFEMIKRTRARA